MSSLAPALSEDRLRAIQEFVRVYDAHYDQVQAALREAVAGLPQFAEAYRSQPREQLEQRSRESRELMRRAVFEGDWDAYLGRLRGQGEAWARLGITLDGWLDLVSLIQREIFDKVATNLAGEPDRMIVAMSGMADFLSIMLKYIGEEYLRTKERVIAHQQQAIAELSTPVLKVRDRMLLLPIVGVVDTERARSLTERLLLGIRAERAQAVVMDITGVAAVDSKVAHHLLQTVAAARLMGADVILTGVSPEVAQALVSLGVDTSGLTTTGDLQSGIEEAERRLRQSTGAVVQG